MAVLSPVMTVMQKTARKAARSLVRDFGEVEQLQVSMKGPADFVSAADLRAEETIIEELSRARPGYGIVTEERGTAGGTDVSHRFFVDPIDGTTNFLHGLPHFAISIGLEREGQLHAGVVYNPIRDEMFWAERGQGAFLNNVRLKVAARRDLRQALVATGIPFHGRDGHERFQTELGRIAPRVAGVRRFGAAALDLALVAAGRFDAFWERGLNAWDVAAGIVLVREAGGEVESLAGGDPLTSGAVLSGNAEIRAQLRPLLQTVNQTDTRPAAD